MSSASKKLITVFGATGAAGGSVAKYLLEDPEKTFAVRAVTRNGKSEEAKALEAQGAEIVEADVNKPETLAAAMRGAYGVLGMTDFWTILRGNGFSTAQAQATEEVQGKNLVDAAKAAGVEHFVFLTLPEGPTCPHFQGKADIAKYLRASGVPFTNICTSLYFENIMTLPAYYAPNDSGIGGTVVIPHPSDSYMPHYSVDQTGGYAIAAFKNRSTWLGKEMVVAGDSFTPRQLAAALSKVLEVPVAVRELSIDNFHALNNPNPQGPQEVVLQELHTMFEIIQADQPPNTMYDLTASKAVYANQHNLETFVRENERFKNWVAKLKAV